jgi:hypothetical protein
VQKVIAKRKNHEIIEENSGRHSVENEAINSKYLIMVLPFFENN